MRIRKVFLSIFLLGIFFTFGKTSAFAESCSISPLPLNGNAATQTVTISGAYDTSQFPNAAARIKEIRFICSRSFVDPIGLVTQTYPLDQITDLGGGNISLTLKNELWVLGNKQKCWPTGTGQVASAIDVIGINGNRICYKEDLPVSTGYDGPMCSITVTPNPPLADLDFTVNIGNLPKSIASNFSLFANTCGTAEGITPVKTFDAGSNGGSITETPKSKGECIIYKVKGLVTDSKYGNVGDQLTFCETDLVVGEKAAIDPGRPGGTKDELVSTDICDFAKESRLECGNCVLGKTIPGKPGIWTAVGCIPANPQDFVARLLQVAIGIAGGIAFLMIMYGGLTMMLSSGNPEKLNGGKEIITSAIAGLLLIIFSVVILKIIGVDILGIPGLL